ncbi:purine/pyrimidine permease [Patescibacteria group bacterium]|nr:purine/pyrimidine permease [Patescibacteria group bacterium]
MANNAKHYEYSVNQVPPPGHLLMSSIQHVLLMIMSLSLPILFASQINGTAEFAASLIAFSMLAAGLGSIIQSVGLPFIGCGYLCPNLCGPSYFSVSLSAAWAGGLPLMRGMIIIAGLVEMAIAPIIQKLKKVFPTFIVGLVMAMVGVSVIKASITSFFGLSFRDDAIQSVDIFVGMFSLMVMVLANLWGKGFVKMYCLLIGMLSGWILALILIPEYWHNLAAIKDFPIFAMPAIGPEFKGITFDFKMILPFVVIGIGGSLKSFGNILVAQKISEPDLKEPNFTPIRKGLLADGFSTVLAGLLGGMAVDTSSSNIGLAGATKVVSRWISVGAGVIFVVLAFFPKFVTILSMMPKPVLGASIIFAGSFMICTGLQEVFSEEWNPRKTFVIGISLFFGLSTAFLPGLYARAPQLIQTFFTDPLPTTTIIAIVLNQIFNFDIVLGNLKNKN